MKCYKCNKGIEDGASLIPIDPKGKGRRWSCLNCTPKEVKIPEDVKELCSVFDSKFKEIK